MARLSEGKISIIFDRAAMYRAKLIVRPVRLWSYSFSVKGKDRYIEIIDFRLVQVVACNQFIVCDQGLPIS